MIEALDIQVKRTAASRIKEVNFDNIQFGKHYSDHMFIADYADGEWKDLRIVPYENLSLSPATAAIHYGQSIFEGMKAHKGPQGDALLFRPQKNHERMNLSAERMCMPTLPEEIFMGGLTQLIGLDADWIPEKPGTSLYVRPFMFATDAYIGVRPSNTYRFMIFTSPAGGYYAEPVRIKVETQYSRAAQGGTGFAKACGNYAGSLYPAKLAQEQGYHQLLWTDAYRHEYIEESGTMNIMFVINNKLITSPLGDTILEGVTRDSVIHVAKEWGVEVEERPITVKEVIDALKDGTLNEAFGTGTAVTVAHVAAIGFEGVDYEIPKPSGQSFSVRVLEALENIKRGKAEDKYGWIYKIN